MRHGDGVLPPALVVLLCSIPASFVCACMCAEPPPPLAALGEADAVFSGTVVERRSGAVAWGAVHCVIDVADVWKGDIGDTAVVQTSSSGASCGYPFRVGKAYLVYAWPARDGSGEWSTSLCTRTKGLEHAGADIAAFGEVGSAGSAADLDRRLVEDAIEELRSPDESIRIAAAERLGTMRRGHDLAIPALEEYYARGTAPERRAAVMAVGHLGWFDGHEGEAVPFLIASLSDSSESVRDAAIFRLSRMQEAADRIVPAMIGLLDDESPNTRVSALLAIRRMSGRGYDVSEDAAAIAERIDDESPQVRQNAMSFLVEIAPDEALIAPLLATVLNDTSAGARASAAGSLGKLGVASEPVMDALFTALDDGSAKVRRGAIRSLERLGRSSSSAISALEGALDDPDRMTREAALRALVALTEHSVEAVRALVRALDHENVAVRTDVARILGRVEGGRSAVVSGLWDAMRDTSAAVRQGVAVSAAMLAPHDADAEALLVEALGDPSSAVRWAAAGAAREHVHPSDEVIDALVRLLDDSDSGVRVTASGTLEKLGWLR